MGLSNVPLPGVPQEPEVCQWLSHVIQGQVLIVHIDTGGMSPLIDVVLETWNEIKFQFDFCLV